MTPRAELVFWSISRPWFLDRVIRSGEIGICLRKRRECRVGRERPAWRVQFEIVEGYTTNVDAEIAASMDEVLEVLTRKGAEIVDVKMPDPGDPGAIWYDIATVEAALAHRDTFPSRADAYGPGLREDLEYGLLVTGTQYAQATMDRARISGQVVSMLQEVDCLVCPSMSNTARLKSKHPTHLDLEEWQRLVINDIFTKPFNFSGVPTLSVPCGFNEEGLPMSVQFVGSKLDEEIICRIGHTYEQATGWHKVHPDI